MPYTFDDRWALARIESGLCRSDPELAGLYAVFTHVSRHEPAIAVEGFSPWRPRVGGIVGSVLAVVAVAALIASAFLLSRFGRVGAASVVIAALLFPPGCLDTPPRNW